MQASWVYVSMDDAIVIQNRVIEELTKEYSEYLEGKGIDIGAKRTNPETGEEENILKNKPLTDEENFFLQYYNRFKNNSNLTVEQVQKWARGIIELEPEKQTGSRSIEPAELFLEQFKLPNEQEESLKEDFFIK